MTQPMLFNEMADDQKAKGDTKALDKRRQAPEPTAEVVATQQEQMVLDELYKLGRADFDVIRAKVIERSGKFWMTYDRATEILGKLVSEGDVAIEDHVDGGIYTPREGV